MVFCACSDEVRQRTTSVEKGVTHGARTGAYEGTAYREAKRLGVKGRSKMTRGSSKPPSTGGASAPGLGEGDQSLPLGRSSPAAPGHSGKGEGNAIENSDLGGYRSVHPGVAGDRRYEDGALRGVHHPCGVDGESTRSAECVSGCRGPVWGFHHVGPARPGVRGRHHGLDVNGANAHHFVLTHELRRTRRAGVPGWAGGGAVFASGDERMPIVFPVGYGYRVRWYDSWNSFVEVMNTRPSSGRVRPGHLHVQSHMGIGAPRAAVWLDIDSCGDSEYAIPAGFSDTHRDWTVNVRGAVVSAVGHVHGHGVAVEATNESQAALPSAGRTPAWTMDSHRVMSMSTCTGDPSRSCGRVKR